ncbi:gamma-glutamyl-gamma-aminobutyrate hydrolase family protein [Candidatus Methylacidithermus pantelleriae]|uniref:Putative Glutamine amidotransferase type-1 domain-containing protein n=1 Tax=Candidatus Methylacidithermus pantelleriae TaxID=2744239 RepID=A0A8J2BJL0_9BACT|nr:gamma-glutamyl-gamma-aminobutyrate hydrolase family protein [Candidatus Methylacidithermus pantelleriae]CAF0697566.1 putative Glutamine amidotransferase type-1 domain-containing protein [Candidatus Methylacidithermus pantelleriae]
MHPTEEHFPSRHGQKEKSPGQSLPIGIPIPHSTCSEYNARSQSIWEEVLRVFSLTPIWLAPDRIPFPRFSGPRVYGLILPGSPADWHWDPELYSAGASAEKIRSPDFVRERVDSWLIEWAWDKELPLLGVCYGLQSLNVCLGGKLHSHVEGHSEGTHRMDVEPGTRLWKLLTGEGRFSSWVVNSSHHQAVDPSALGQGLRVSAFASEDQVVEALEGQREDWFLFGVQWHPERDWEQSPASKALLGAFAQAAQTYARSQGITLKWKREASR